MSVTGYESISISGFNSELIFIYCHNEHKHEIIRFTLGLSFCLITALLVNN